MTRPRRSPVQDSPDGAVLTVHVQPKASRTEYIGVYGDALNRVAAPPADGAANEALCAYLVQKFHLTQKAVLLQTGHGSRHKRVILLGVSAQRVRDLFHFL